MSILFVAKGVTLIPTIYEPTQAEQDQSSPASPARLSGSSDVKSRPISEGKQRGHSLRVLLVDDNSASQQAMRRIIINAGRARQILLATSSNAI